MLIGRSLRVISCGSHQVLECLEVLLKNPAE